MKKKLAVGVLSALLLVGGATSVLGADAVESGKLEEIKSLTQEMFGIHKKIIAKELETGLLTQEQADRMNESINLRQQRSEEMLANGQVPGFGKHDWKMNKFNNGEPLTEEQIATWAEQAQAHLKAQEEAMRTAGKLTDDQIKTWVEAAQAQLKVQEEAMKNGTFIPGGMGMSSGKGMHGGKGMRGGIGSQALTATPEVSATTNY